MITKKIKYMEQVCLESSIRANRIILKRRLHDCDEEMWPLVDTNRQFLREYLFWVDSTISLDSVVCATNFFINLWDEKKNWCYNIYRLQDNKLLGCIDAHNLNFQNRKAEIGYWLSQDETHKGYMKEAVETLEKELFKIGFHRVEIHCDKNNRRSALVAERCNYELEYISKESMYHYTGLHDRLVYVKFSPYPIKGF